MPTIAPEVLAEDPAPSAARGRLRALLGLAVAAGFATGVGAAIWPLYLLLRTSLPRPPHLPAPARVRAMARLLRTAEVPAPGLHPLDRARLGLHLWIGVALAPLDGLAWMLDELLFRRALAAHPVEAPLFEVSAWRSGSTRLAHVLHDDPRLAAPTLLMMVAPYLWLWKLVRRVLGGRIDPDAVTRWMRASVPPAFAERHEIDPFRTDTYDVLFYRLQWVPFAMAFGPAPMLAHFSHRGVTPETRELWEQDFVRMLDGLGRRTLAFRGPAPDGRPRRFFLKGHFLAAAPALAARWPDAAFVTVVRDPVARLRSTLNYLRLSPDFFGLGPTPWPWIVEMAGAERDYDRTEAAWFSRDDGVRRCVLTFEQLVGDLPGALRAIGATCFPAGEPPPAAVAPHPPRSGGPYAVDHPLEALGIDVDALRAEAADARAWCARVGSYRPVSDP